jgi:hypothetical protein
MGVKQFIDSGLSAFGFDVWLIHTEFGELP